VADNRAAPRVVPQRSHGGALPASERDWRSSRCCRNSERIQRAFVLQLMLGELLMVAKGMAAHEAREAYSRAYALCQQMGETRQRFRALWCFHPQA